MTKAAKAVKRIRDAIYLQQNEFAALLGVTTQSVINYEKGIRNPKRSIVRKLKEIADKKKIKFSFDDFIGE